MHQVNEWKVAAIQRGTLYPDSKLKNTKLPKLSPLQLSKMEQQRWKNGKHRDLPDHILEQQDQEQRERQHASTAAGSSPNGSDDDYDVDDYGNGADSEYDMDVDPDENEDQQNAQPDPPLSRTNQSPFASGAATPQPSDAVADQPDRKAFKQRLQDLPYPIPEDPNVQIPHNFLSGLLVDRRDEVEAFIYRNTADLDLDDLSLLRQQLWDKIERSCLDQYYNNH